MQTLEINIKDVWKSYKRGEIEVPVLRGLNCHFAPGAFHFIVGPSGSGKSSLLYLLGSLDTPNSGEIRIAGRNLSDWTESEKNQFRREEVGFIFQNFNLMANLTAWDNVLIPYLPAGITADLKEEAKRLLIRVGLEHRLDHKPSQLSGGEQQRVAIARALLKQPRLILADEPTGELDSQTGRDVIECLRTLSQQHQATAIIVTHDTTHMQPQDWIHRIHDGVIQETRSPEG